MFLFFVTTNVLFFKPHVLDKRWLLVCVAPLMRRRLSPVPPLDSPSTSLPSKKRLAVFLMSRSLYDFSAKHGFLTEKCIKDRIDASFRCDRQSVIMRRNELNLRSTTAALNGTHNNNSTRRRIFLYFSFSA